METWKICILGAAAGIGAAIVIIWLIQKSNKNIKNENVLISAFGEPLYSEKFTLQQTKEWLKKREGLIKSGCKALVLKANEELLKSIGKNLDIGSDVDNFLVIAVINTVSKEIEDSVLVKYDSLEDDLENLLSKGNGTLVVGG
ncbi:MAG: hypothetical protein NC320_13320 [Clostridium sp.]|nr:hypothetical protein [Clostridium sp.]